jgi:CysZ protein
MYGFTRGLDGFARAFGFILRNRMGWMFLAPVLLWALFALGLFQTGNWLVDAVQAWSENYLGLDVPSTGREGWPGFWDDLKAVVNGTRDVLVWLVLKLAIFWLVSVVGKYVVLALLSPLLAHASERAEGILTGVITPFHVARWLREVLRGMAMALRNGSVELLITIAAWAITFFLPLLSPITALVLWGVSCWFYGFSMFDYVHERRGLGLRASVRAARDRGGMVLANGLLFNLLMKVPVLGMITAPLLGAVGAVLASVGSARRTLPTGQA